MKKTRLLLIVLFAALALVLGACVPGPRVTGAPGVTVFEEMTFVSYGPFVYALDNKDGSVEWQYPSDADNQIVFYAQPLVTNDSVYVGDLSNTFYKLDRDTGELEWTFSGSKGYFIGKAAAHENLVFAPSNDGSLYALDVETGEKVWDFPTEHYLWAQPLVVDDVVYLGSMDHTMYAIALEGTEIWSEKMAGAIVSPPVVSEDGSRLYVTSLGNEVVALDLEKGEKVWTLATDSSVWGSPVLHEDHIFFADSEGNVYAYNASDESSYWQTDLDGKVLGMTAIEDGFVLVTEQGDLKFFTYEGSPGWEATLAGEMYQAPSVNGENLMVGTVNGEELVYAFTFAGVQLWSMTPNK